MTRDEYLYLDHAAATPVDGRVLAAMEPYWSAHPANPDALHAEGVRAHRAVEEARATVAACVGAQTDEIVFTSGGTEANALAIMGAVRARVSAGRAMQDVHLVTSAVEHSSVLESFRALAREGAQVTILPVNGEGWVDRAALRESIRPETVLVSTMLVNNEVGTIEELEEVARVVRHARERYGTDILLHTDACQAPAWLPCKVDRSGVDLMSLDAQKVYGPKGVGCLYRKRATALEPLSYGGGQEFGLRPGTPATPLVVGFARALALAEEERDSYVPHTTALRDRIIAALEEAHPTVRLNGPRGSARVANNINVSYGGLEGEQIVIELDARGVGVSTRSACLRSEVPGSYVVGALSGDTARSVGAVRMTLSRHTTEVEADRAANALIEVVHWLQGGAA